MKPYKILLCIFALSTSTHAFPDTYIQWQPQISKATNGLFVCMDLYERALSGKNSESARRTKLKEADQRCRVLQSVFDTTMLTARSNITGMEKSLGDFHEAMISMFDYVKPDPDQSLLSYITLTQKTRKEVAEIELLMTKESLAIE